VSRLDSAFVSLLPKIIFSWQPHDNVDKTVASEIHYSNKHIYIDRLCGLVVRVLGYRSGGPGLIPGTTRKKKQ
jgi:hypothetical protein